MRKPAFCVPVNKRPSRSAPLFLLHRTIKTQNFKSLVIFNGCKAQFVSDLVENPEDRFSHDAADLIYCK